MGAMKVCDGEGSRSACCDVGAQTVEWQPATDYTPTIPAAGSAWTWCVKTLSGLWVTASFCPGCGKPNQRMRGEGC